MKQDLEKAENAYLSSFISKKSKTLPECTAAAHGDPNGKNDYSKKVVSYVLVVVVQRRKKNQRRREAQRRRSRSRPAYPRLFEYKSQWQADTLTTWPPIEMHAVIRCEWTGGIKSVRHP
ncbi:hypothetical protein TNCV_3827741 [Trichonephila clavipes]|nr:hypothetical protein TNCV_3827741 [Trichonephila clavipes]